MGQAHGEVALVLQHAALSLSAGRRGVTGVYLTSALHDARTAPPKLGALMPLQAVPGVLDTFLPTLSSFNHNTTRDRLLRVGQAIEAELQDNIQHKANCRGFGRSYGNWRRRSICQCGADEDPAQRS
jgi:hypothetical protein